MGPAKDKHGARESFAKVKFLFAKNGRSGIKEFWSTTIYITYIYIHIRDPSSRNVIKTCGLENPPLSSMIPEIPIVDTRSVTSVRIPSFRSPGRGVKCHGKMVLRSGSINCSHLKVILLPGWLWFAYGWSFVITPMRGSGLTAPFSPVKVHKPSGPPARMNLRWVFTLNARNHNRPWHGEKIVLLHTSPWAFEKFGKSVSQLIDVHDQVYHSLPACLPKSPVI